MSEQDNQDCIFCALQHNEAGLVAANEQAYAILDIAPIRPGHVLVIPRCHVEDFFELDEAVQAAMLQLGNRIAAALKDCCNPERVGMMVAGFDVPHAHLHLIPVHDFTDITPKPALDGSKVMAAEEELAAMRDALRKRLGGDC